MGVSAMLVLGRRNNDSLAREFDWFGSSDRLEISPASIWVPDEDETLRRRVTGHNPQVVEENFDDQWGLHEISPQVSVRDEDSFAKPVAVPEIKPHVSVQDEDSFAQPCEVPKISPHVSVRDEDSFAKPVALPEINPHVSVRDEDSFAKPSPLPEITPHVSVRDEDSFAKPSALPEIHPQISILDESSASAGEAASSDLCDQQLDPDVVNDTSVHSLDEAMVQPGEPSFVTVTLEGQNKKKFVQEYMELRSSHPTELESNSPSELESIRPIELEPSRPIELQPSHPIELQPSRPIELQPSRPIESKPSRPTELEPSRPIELQPSRPIELQPSRPIELQPSRPIELQPSRSTVMPLVRVLDESQVLPGEASFATAIPDGPSAPHTHSPLEEFLAKTNMDLRTFGLATLLFISIIGVSALVIMEATTGIFSSQLVASATTNLPSQSAESVMPQPEVLSTTKSVAPVAVPKPSKQESQSMAPPREYSKFPGEVTNPPSISDLSRKANSNVRANDVRAEKADKKSAVKSESREVVRERDKHAASPKNLRANMKESGARKKVAESRHSTSSQKRAEVNKSSSRTTARKPVSASAKDAAITKPKGETKVPSASNGAQRPRTVTQRKTVVGG